MVVDIPTNCRVRLLHLVPILYKHNIGARSRNHTYRAKTSSVTYSGCVSVALVSEHAKRMRHIIRSFAPRLGVPYFSTLYHIRRCFSTAGPRPGTGPWHQLYRAARGLRKLQYATRFH